MDEEQTASNQKYITNCFFCKKPFDAQLTEWCNCLTTERSFVCTHCNNCFCQAPSSYKQKFWADAPPSIWDRKWKMSREVMAPIANPDNPLDVKRPLILVVEDEKEIQRVAARVIESLGYGMILAKDGVEGLLLARRYMPDLILSDALMPKMDGREMCRQLKEDSTTAKIKVIIMTSLYTGIKYKIEAHKKFQVDDYLSKPLEFEKLQEILQKHLA